MQKIVECVPNFSEGRRGEVVEAIAEAIKSVEAVKLVDYSADRDHNRCVMTFLGPPEGVSEAAFRAIAKAVELIDLNKHKGEHPRIGAADVVPFVPLKNITTEECVSVAHKLGERVASELGVPVYFYGAAALRPERKELSYIRRGGFEALKVEIASEDRKPDLGPAQLHPTAGATVIGVRGFLVAYNVNLDTDKIEVARAIAKAVRSGSGGLANLRAMGVRLKDRGLVQVSMNLVNPEQTPLYRVFELVKIEAAKFGVNVLESEIIGAPPLDVIVDTFKYYLKVKDFDSSRVLDIWLAKSKR